MGFEVKIHDAVGEPMVEMTERLCLTEDGRLVGETDLDARWLYCVPGHRVPLSDAQRYGLVAPAEPTPEAEPQPEPEPEPEPAPEPELEPEPKAQRPAANKMRGKREDK